MAIHQALRGSLGRNQEIERRGEAVREKEEEGGVFFPSEPFADNGFCFVDNGSDQVPPVTQLVILYNKFVIPHIIT